MAPPSFKTKVATRCFAARTSFLFVPNPDAEDAISILWMENQYEQSSVFRMQTVRAYTQLLILFLVHSPLSLFSSNNSLIKTISSCFERRSKGVRHSNMSDPAAEPVAQMDTGVSQETYNRLKDELANVQKEAAIFKAKMEVHDQRQRSTLRDMQPEVSAFVGDIVADAEFANFKHELEPMTRFCNDMEKSDQVETTVSLGRLISCASAKLKRTRVEASKQAENAELLSSETNR